MIKAETVAELFIHLILNMRMSSKCIRGIMLIDNDDEVNLYNTPTGP